MRRTVSNGSPLGMFLLLRESPGPPAGWAPRGRLGGACQDQRSGPFLCWRMFVLLESNAGSVCRETPGPQEQPDL